MRVLPPAIDISMEALEKFLHVLVHLRVFFDISQIALLQRIQECWILWLSILGFREIPSARRQRFHHSSH